MKTIDDIRPPVPVTGMEKPLDDYSARLARRTGVVEVVVAVKYDRREREKET